MQLQAKLDAFKADFEAGKPPYSVPPSVIEVMHRGGHHGQGSAHAEERDRVGESVPIHEGQFHEGQY